MRVPGIFVLLAGVTAAIVLLLKLRRRLQLSKAKHPSLRGHSRIALRVARLVPFYEDGEAELFRSDGAPEEIAQRRRDGFLRLSALFEERFATTARLTA